MKKFLKGLAITGSIVVFVSVMNHIFCTLRPMRARKAVAEYTIMNIRNALNSYYEDVGYYPPGNAENDEGNISLMEALCGVSESMGGKGGPNSPYYELEDKFCGKSEYSPAKPVFIDLWGVPWRYNRAKDEKGNIKLGIHNKESYDLWSCGPNMKDEKGLGDDINNWR